MSTGAGDNYRVRVMKRLGPILVFSEVDGVFRDPCAGSLASAARVLRELACEEVAVVLCSSKTRAELEQIQQELGIKHPFVCENGGALFIPPAYFDFAVPHAREIAGYQVVEFGRPYAEVVDVLHRAADHTAVEILGFSDMSVDEVAHECDVPLLQARLAKLREYDEPFRIVDPTPKARTRLLKTLTSARLQYSRMCHLDRVGGVVDRGKVMKLLCSLVRRSSASLVTVALADPRDEGNLLRLADHSVPLPDGHGNASPIVDAVSWAEWIMSVVHGLGRGDTWSSQSQAAGVFRS
jgi:mannosyl-3-phosphoglycerate phosphatase